MREAEMPFSAHFLGGCRPKTAQSLSVVSGVATYYYILATVLQYTQIDHGETTRAKTRPRNVIHISPQSGSAEESRADPKSMVGLTSENNLKENNHDELTLAPSKLK